MKPRRFSPDKLDVQAFIESGERLGGDLPMMQMARLSEGLLPGLDLSQLRPVRWSAVGRLVPQRGGPPQHWLDIEAAADTLWECQRCLSGVALTLEVHRSIRFAPDEEQAAVLDADSDDDVLALSRNFDLLGLLEDELIMAQPIVPRHEVCPDDPLARTRASVEAEVSLPGESQTSAPAQDPGKPHPFAALAALKKKVGD